jgi:hypothetical protein
MVEAGDPALGGMKSCTSAIPSDMRKRVMSTFVSGKHSCLGNY